MTWTTDEFGNRYATIQGWSFKVWAFGQVDCTGPDGEDLNYDEDSDEILILHDAPYEGSVGVPIPWTVLTEFVRLTKEQQDA